MHRVGAEYDRLRDFKRDLRECSWLAAHRRVPEAFAIAQRYVDGEISVDKMKAATSVHGSVFWIDNCAAEIIAEADIDSIMDELTASPLSA